MGDLDNSPLFDKRHVQFISRILQGRPMNPLSGVEQQFLRQALVLKELNEKYDYDLIGRLEAYKRYVAVQVAVQFLVQARQHGMLDDAITVLETSIEEERGGDLKDLMRILEESKSIPAAWAVTVYGEGTEDRHKRETYTMPSGLNLEAMRNFK